MKELFNIYNNVLYYFGLELELFLMYKVQWVYL